MPARARRWPGTRRVVRRRRASWTDGATRTEHHDQVDVIRWVDDMVAVGALPGLDTLFAVPNAAAGPLRGQAGKMKAEGARPGVPDLVLPVRRAQANGMTYNGLWIEMKHGKGKPTPAQLAWHAKLRREGHLVLVYWTPGEAVTTIERYLRGELR